MAAQDRWERAPLTQPGAEAELIEAGGLGVTPRVVGIDGRRERGELPLQALGVGPFERAHPRSLVADVHALMQAPGHLAGIGDVAGLDRESEL